MSQVQIKWQKSDWFLKDKHYIQEQFSWLFLWISSVGISPKKGWKGHNEIASTTPGIQCLLRFSISNPHPTKAQRGQISKSIKCFALQKWMWFADWVHQISFLMHLILYLLTLGGCAFCLSIWCVILESLICTVIKFQQPHFRYINSLRNSYSFHELMLSAAFYLGSLSHLARQQLRNSMFTVL